MPTFTQSSKAREKWNGDMLPVSDFLAREPKDLTDKVKAGALVKELAPIVGGGGGGRPDFAKAGGKDASKIGDLLTRAREMVTAALG